MRLLRAAAAPTGDTMLFAARGDGWGSGWVVEATDGLRGEGHTLHRSVGVAARIRISSVRRRGVNRVRRSSTAGLGSPRWGARVRCGAKRDSKAVRRRVGEESRWLGGQIKPRPIGLAAAVVSVAGAAL